MHDLMYQNKICICHLLSVFTCVSLFTSVYVMLFCVGFVFKFFLTLITKFDFQYLDQ